MKLALVVLLGLQPAVAQHGLDPAQVIQAMHDRYVRSYPSTITFRQLTVNIAPDGERHEDSWFESMRLPGGLSIRFAPFDSGNGILFVRDSLFVFSRGSVRSSRPLMHPLLLLGFDVYAQPPSVTVQKLRDDGYDMSTMHEGKWEGRPVYVIGAKAGDDTSKQFWIEKERLLLVRTLEINRRLGVPAEVRFEEYQQMAGGWIESLVRFYRAGKVATEEHYSEIRTNVWLDDREFDPVAWGRIPALR